MRALLVSAVLFLAVSAAAEQPVALPQGASENWWGDAQRSIRASEYEPKLHGGVLAAPNRAQGFRTFFEGGGVRVVPRDGSEAWRWEIGLAGAAPVPPQANGTRVEYRRGEVVEWYVNGDQGLEHGFTLAGPVTEYVRGDVLRLPLRVGGTLHARAHDGGRIDFLTSVGAPAIRYDHLVVVDASGRTLPSRMELQGAEVHLVADVDGAAWPVVVDPMATSPVWTFESDQDGARLGMSVASAGDVNGDGFGDVIVGAPYYDTGLLDAGHAFVFHGSAAGLSATANWIAAADRDYANFGMSVASAGDVNGDGYDDVIVGADTYTNGQISEGGAFVYHGSSGGLSGTPAWTVESDQAQSNFGYSVASAGDVNGDGYADVIVGAYSYGNGQLGEGRAFLYHGSPTGLSGSANWTAESNQADAYLGTSVASAGDVNGDGYADVIIGVGSYTDGQAEEGRALVYHGSATGLSAAGPDWAVESNQASTYFGSSVATAGDVNGDGYADVIVGAHSFDNPQGNEGRVFVYHGSSSGLATSASWTAESDQVLAYFGVSVGSAGDVNGDGYGDVIIGAHRFSGGQTDEGRVFVYQGSATGLAATASWTAESDQASAYFGYSVASAGDVNGDGYADVIVGAESWDGGLTDEGGAFVYHGSAAGLSAAANWTAGSDQANAYFGWSVASAGDVNGDGYSDVIVGAFSYDGGQVDEGRAYVFHGSAAGLSATANWWAESNQPNTIFGWSVASAGDVNGDGYSDVIVGAEAYDGGEQDEGRAYVYHGSAAGLSATPNWTAESNQADTYFGSSVASAGDVNGDGYSDVIVGAYGYAAGQPAEGRAFVYHGSAAGLSDTAHWTAESDQASAYFGCSVATAGDVNGDGYSDVIVGAYGYDGGQSDEGRAFVYRGSATGLSTTASWTAESDQAAATLGWSVASAGDVNGDGYSDVIVGAYAYDGGQTDEGRVFVYHGSAAGLSETASWTVESDQASAYFGSSVASAGDVNGDGYADVIVGAYGYDGGQTDEGRAFVYHGSATGLSASEVWAAEGDQLSAFFGESVASAGDVNGDGFADVVVGAWFFSSGLPYGGRAFVYYGNQSAGRLLVIQQLRGDGAAPVQEWGLSHSGTSFVVTLNANSPRGREQTKLQAEACPAGSDFGSGSCTTFTSTSWTDVGVDGTARIQLPITGLATGTLYHWRARALFAPVSVIAAGITAPPAPQHTPWRRLAAQEDNSDVRVVSPQTVTIGLVSATASVVEAGPNAAMQIVVTTSNDLPTGEATSITYATANGTAIAGSDYTTTSGTLDIPAGTPSAAILTVNVPLTPDTVDETNETLTFTLSAPVGASLGPTTTSTVTIIDDDTPPAFSVNDVTLAEGDSGTTVFTFTVTKTGSTDRTATVDVATADGSATVADGDYGAVSLNTLSFTPAQATRTVTVNVTGDAKFESSETFLVNLTNATNATIGDDHGSGTITNDDAEPALAIDDVTHAEGNSGTTSFVFTVTLAGVTALPVTVNYTTTPGTATAGTDYTAASGMLTFTPGALTQTVTVNAKGDTTYEPDETFTVSLSGATNATIADAAGTGTIQNDDALPTLSINSVAQAEGSSGMTSFVFTVTLTGATEQVATVAYATSNNTATAGADYTATSGTLTFAPGDTTETITVSVVGEAAVENDETFIVSLSAPVHAAIVTGTATGTIVNDDASPFGPPQLFSATTVSASTIHLQWAPVSGATGYEIHRATSVGSGYSLLTTTAATSYNDSGLAANTAYLYRVRAFSGSAMSGFSAVDAATTTVFTDATLGSTIRIKAVHVTQLRTAVNALRTAGGLTPAYFGTDPTITPGVTRVKGAHITELRTALDQARSAVGLPGLTYTDGALLSGRTIIRAVHVTELRNGTQ